MIELHKTPFLSVSFERRESNILFITFADLFGYKNGPFAYEVVKRVNGGADHLSFICLEGDSYQTLDIELFNKLVKDIGIDYDFYYFYGFSTGAHAAIYFASNIELSNKVVIALSPLVSFHPFMDGIKFDWPFKAPPPYSFNLDFEVKNSFIIYDALLENDCKFVNSVYNKSVNSYIISAPGFGHNTLDELIKRKLINLVLAEIFRIRRVSISDFEQAAEAIRSILSKDLLNSMRSPWL